MPTVSFDKIDLYYERRGSGRPLLFVSGYGGVASYWQPQIADFSRYFDTITHDHRGAGRSTHDTTIEYSVDQMSRDVIALMDALGIAKAHVVGHSLGGAIGQHLAITHPERMLSLVIYASFTRFDEVLKRYMEIRESLLLGSGARAFVRSAPTFLYPGSWLNENRAFLDQMEETMLAQLPPTEVTLARTKAVAEFDVTRDLHRLTLPTLLICAKDDVLTPPYFTEELATLIPHARVVWLDKGGHACSQTEADCFNRAVLSFMRAIP